MASYEPELLGKMMEYQLGMKGAVMGKAAKLEEQGWAVYTPSAH